MSKRQPPPSLGKLSPKNGRKIDKYGEWQILKQEVDAWERYITPILHLQGFKKIRVFAVGAPRKFELVTTAHFGLTKYYKRQVRDIRTASHQHWIDEFILSEWQVQNHVIDDGD